MPVFGKPIEKRGRKTMIAPQVEMLPIFTADTPSDVALLSAEQTPEEIVAYNMTLTESIALDDELRVDTNMIEADMMLKNNSDFY